MIWIWNNWSQHGVQDIKKSSIIKQKMKKWLLRLKTIGFIPVKLLDYYKSFWFYCKDKITGALLIMIQKLYSW